MQGGAHDAPLYALARVLGRMAADYQLVSGEGGRQEVVGGSEPSKAAVLVAGLADPESDSGSSCRAMAIVAFGANRCHPFAHPL